MRSRSSGPDITQEMLGHSGYQLWLGPMAYWAAATILAAIATAALVVGRPPPGRPPSDAHVLTPAVLVFLGSAVYLAGGLLMRLWPTWRACLLAMALGLLGCFAAPSAVALLALEMFRGDPLSLRPLTYPFMLWLIATVSAGAVTARAAERIGVSLAEPVVDSPAAQYRAALAKLVVRIMSVDSGRLERAERSFFRAFARSFGVHGWKASELLRHAESSQEDRSELVSTLVEAGRHLGQEEPLDLVLHWLARAAEADGPMNEEERMYILQVASAAGWDRRRTEAWLEADRRGISANAVFRTSPES